MARAGAFIGIEGIDGSGKSTQHGNAITHLRSRGFEVVEFDFPQYDTPMGILCAEYLNGRFGHNVNPRLASALFAADRAAATPLIRQVLASGKMALTNRFTLSNAAHQGGKIHDREERAQFYSWLFNLEHEKMGIPLPDAYIYLRIDPTVGQQNVDKKASRGYTKRQRDIHEMDVNHLTHAMGVYDELATLYPDQVTVIECMSDGKMMGLDAIAKLVANALDEILAK